MVLSFDILGINVEVTVANILKYANVANEKTWVVFAKCPDEN